MSTDWRAKIIELVRWKQIIAEADALGAFPWHLPRVRASPEQVAKAEALRGRLSPDYREFLLHADGWKGFLISTDLFGTMELMDSGSMQALEQDNIRQALERAGVEPTHVTVIGTSEFDLDLFVSVSRDSNVLSDAVIWLAAEEIDRFPTFTEFFDAMIAYNARLAQQLVAQAAH